MLSTVRMQLALLPVMARLLLGPVLIAARAQTPRPQPGRQAQLHPALHVRLHLPSPPLQPRLQPAQQLLLPLQVRSIPIPPRPTQLRLPHLILPTQWLLNPALPMYLHLPSREQIRPQEAQRLLLPPQSRPLPIPLRQAQSSLPYLQPPLQQPHLTPPPQPVRQLLMLPQLYLQQPPPQPVPAPVPV